MITTTILKALKSNSWKIPRSQYDWYKSKNASEDILKYTSLNGKTFTLRCTTKRKGNKISKDNPLLYVPSINQPTNA